MFAQALRRGALVLASMFASGAASAYDFTGCQVLEVVSQGPQNVHVQLSCNIANRPGCATAPMYFGFDGSTVEGKRHFAMVMMAQATNAALTGHIDQSCPAFQNNVALLSHLRMSR